MRDVETLAWAVAGSYFEACNCLPICPCRQVGGREGGRSTFGVCDFALSWSIANGHAGELDLAGRQVVMVGSYSDDAPGSPWNAIRTVVTIPERAVKVGCRSDVRERASRERATASVHAEIVLTLTSRAAWPSLTWRATLGESRIVLPRAVTRPASDQSNTLPSLGTSSNNVKRCTRAHAGCVRIGNGTAIAP